MDAPFIRRDVGAFLDWLNSHPGPRMYNVPVAQARRMQIRLGMRTENPVGPLAIIRDLAMPGPDGTPLRLRIFDARNARLAGPALIFYHGGGFVVGDLDTHAALCAEIARLIDLPVIAVDYRLAPEHPFPAAPEDAEAAARWIADSPAELGLDVTGLILAGDSAGGTLAIVTALALRDQAAHVPVLASWACYPAVTPGTRSASFEAYGDGYLLDRATLAWFFNHYAANVRDWRATPIRHAQTGLPPTLIMTAGLDPLRDQGHAYVEQCRNDGVITAYHEAKGTIHAFLTMRKAMPSGEEDLRICIALLKKLIDR